MTTATKKRTLEDMLAMPKAVRGPAVTQISAEMRGCHMRSDPIPAFGHDYVIRTLEPGEQDAANRFVKMSSLTQASSMINKAWLACALVSIDGRAVAEEFRLPDGLDPSARAAFEDPATLKDWLELQVFEWLSADGQEPLLDLLVKEYLALMLKRNERMEALKRPFERTTSSPTGPTPSSTTGTSSAGS